MKKENIDGIKLEMFGITTKNNVFLPNAIIELCGEIVKTVGRVKTLEGLLALKSMLEKFIEHEVINSKNGQKESGIGCKNR